MIDKESLIKQIEILSDQIKQLEISEQLAFQKLFNKPQKEKDPYLEHLSQFRKAKERKILEMQALLSLVSPMEPEEAHRMLNISFSADIAEQ